MYTRLVVLATITLASSSSDLVSAQHLTRSAAKQIALENNPKVASAKAEWEVARARRLVAISLENPELEFEYEELPGIFDTGKFGERTIGITQKIKSPFKWWFQQRASAHEAEALRYTALEATRLDIATLVEINFDRVLADKKILGAAEENLRLAKDFAKKTLVRFDAGDVAKLEVMSARVQEALAKNNYAEAESQLASSKAALRALLGQDGSASIEIEGEFTLDPVSDSLMDLKERARSRRPDLKGAQLQFLSAKSSMSGTVASLVPDLNLGISRQTVGAPGSRTSYWRTSFGFEIPMWALFRQRGEVNAAAAEVRKAEATREALRRTASLDVEVSYSALSTARKRVEAFEGGVLELAKAVYEVASESYRQGKASYLEVLGAQKTLTETKIAYFESIYKYRRARAEMARATGGSL